MVLSPFLSAQPKLATLRHIPLHSFLHIYSKQTDCIIDLDHMGNHLHISCPEVEQRAMRSDIIEICQLQSFFVLSLFVKGQGKKNISLSLFENNCKSSLKSSLNLTCFPSPSLNLDFFRMCFGLTARQMTFFRVQPINVQEHLSENSRYVDISILFAVGTCQPLNQEKWTGNF